jgi:amidase
METATGRRDFLLATGAATVALLTRGLRGQVAVGAAKSSFTYASARETVAALATRQVSSAELVNQAVARIEALDSRINAVVVRDFERARAAARQADAAIGRGEKRPLLGLPMTVKESFNVAGLPTTWGLPSAKGWQPAEDAVVVARLKAAGAIILGKTNVPLMLADFQSYNEIYGTTNNPWDLARTPGGSSGGSAAAVAVGYVPLEMGSDLGGSLRAPAHYCGVFGHKPTHEVVPHRGHTPPRARPLPGWTDLSVVGPMARSAADLALGLDVVAGPDEPDAVGYRLALPPPRHSELKEYRVVLVDSHPLIPTAAAVRTAIDRLGDRLVKAGCKVERGNSSMPDLARSAQLYALLQNAVSGGGMDAQGYERARAGAASIPADSTDLAGLRLRGTVLSHREWLRAHGARREVQQQWRELFRSVDVVVCPVHPVPAWPHDHTPRESRVIEIDGEKRPWMDTLRVWGSVATVPGLPATAAPIGLSDTGLPIGVQIVGPQLEDRTTIEFARLMEREFGGFVPPPGFSA